MAFLVAPILRPCVPSTHAAVRNPLVNRVRIARRLRSPTSSLQHDSLPPSSQTALQSSALLMLAAVAVPVVLSYQDACHLHQPMLALLATKYQSHLHMAAYIALFGALHSGLASLRPTAVRRIGERAYRVVFALASIPSAVALIAYFIAHRYDGAQLWSLQGFPYMHEICYALTFVSFLLLYPATFNLLEVAAIQKPGFRMYETGVTRITRHPQLWGQVLWCLAHCAWMGTSLPVVASLGLVAHHCFGAWNGDRRLRDRFGEEWLQLEQRTSIVPFAAVMEGKQQLQLGEFVRPAYLGVVVFVLATYAAHPLMLRTVGQFH